MTSIITNGLPRARSVPLVAGTAAALLVVLLAASLTVGSPLHGPAEVWHAVLDRGPDRVAVLRLRLPRALLAAAAGATLAVVGHLLQDAFCNPLAGPELTGATPGAALGLAAAAVTAPAAGTAWRAGAVLAGALLVGAVVLALATRIRDPLALAVAGATVGAVASSLTIALVALGSETAVGLLFTSLFGSLAGRTWDDLGTAAVGSALTLAAAAPLAARVELLGLGEASAHTLGARPGLVRVTVLAVSALATTAVVLACGAVGFVALAAPHLARRLTGRGETTRVLPVTALVGAVLVLLADLVARTVVAPGEVPLGVATALLGGPVVLAVLRKAGSW